MSVRTDAPEVARALSISRPWPYCILHLAKLLENRGRRDGKEPKALTRYRGELYIHAAKSWDARAAETIIAAGIVGDRGDMARLLRTKIKHVAGAIVGKCRVVGYIEPWDCGACGGGSTGAWAGCSECSGTLNPGDLDLRWWQGGYALVLADVTAFDEPIPCTGRLNIWTIPDDVRQRVLAVERRMKSKADRKYKCRTCGSMTSGRRGLGDSLKHYPRRHRLFGGTTCPGSFEAAIIVAPP